MKRKHKLLKRIIFAVEVAVLIAMIGGLYVYGQLTERLSTINEAPEVTLNDEGEVSKGVVVTNPEAPRMTGYRTYALFGIDHRDKNAALAGENSDTMIICSINNDTQEVRMVSVYRDTLLNIGDDIYAKANAAYAYGGPQQAVNMLNTNLDLNITDYVTIDFNALVEAVDALGGLDVPLSYAEIVHLNNYCIETSEETGKSYTPVELPAVVPENQEEIIGTYHLNGVQVTSYCRIRYTSKMDMGRTERQRYTVQSIIAKASTAGLGTIFEVMDKVFPMVKTSLSLTEILKMIPQVMNYNISQTGGFPMMYKFSNVRGSIIVPMTLSTNVSGLHEFLYGDPAYQPSPEVQSYSDMILAIVGGAENTQEEAPVVDYKKGDEEDIFIWQDNGSGGNTYVDYGYTDVTYDPWSVIETSSGTDTHSGTGTDTSGGSSAGTVTGGGSSAGTDTSGGSSAGTAAGGGAYAATDTGGGSTVEPGGGYVDPGSNTGTDSGTGSWDSGSSGGESGGGYVDPSSGGESGYDPGISEGGGEAGYDPGYYEGGGDTGYDTGGYDAGGYDAGGYDAGGYDVGGYDAGGYDAGGYDELSAG